MKRLIFATIALAAFATSCTKSEMIEAPDFGGQPITFDTYLGKVPMTKAQSVDLAYLQGTNRGFHVKHLGIDCICKAVEERKKLDGVTEYVEEEGAVLKVNYRNDGKKHRVDREGNVTVLGKQV